MRSHRAPASLALLSLISTLALAACGSGPPLPALTATFVAAVNSTDVTIVPASSVQERGAKVTQKAAVATALRQEQPGTVATAAELVELTNAQFPAGHLVWAVEDDPVGNHQGGIGGVGMKDSTPSYNLSVDFVNAVTGHWLEGVTGYSSKLPPLRVIPAATN